MRVSSAFFLSYLFFRCGLGFELWIRLLFRGKVSCTQLHRLDHIHIYIYKRGAVVHIQSIVRDDQCHLNVAHIHSSITIGARLLDPTQFGP